MPGKRSPPPSFWPAGAASGRHVHADEVMVLVSAGAAARLAHFALTECWTTSAGTMWPAWACFGSPPHVPRLFAAMAVTTSSFFRRGARSRRRLSRSKSTAAAACHPPAMSNNEDAAAALGHSEELSVQNSVSDPIPELSQGPEDGSKRPSGVDRQHTRDVFPDDPPRSQALNSAEKFQREVATRVIHSKPVAGDAKGLAGSSSDEKLNWSCSDAPEPVPPDRREIAKVPYLRIAVRQDRAREWIYLGEPRGGPAADRARQRWPLRCPSTPTRRSLASAEEEAHGPILTGISASRILGGSFLLVVRMNLDRVLGDQRRIDAVMLQVFAHTESQPRNSPVLNMWTVVRF